MDSQFPFISDTTLRNNLDEVFAHIVQLVSIVDDTHYPPEAKSAFCKTIIIHTGAIIEALLFTVMDATLSNDEVNDFYSTWQLKNKKELHSIDENTKVVAGNYVRVHGKGGKKKLNLGQINNILHQNSYISEDLHKKVDSVRTLRNEQHLATQERVRKYTRKDLNRVFAIAREVKEFVQKKSTV